MQSISLLKILALAKAFRPDSTVGWMPPTSDPATQPLEQGDGSSKIDCNNPDVLHQYIIHEPQGNRPMHQIFLSEMLQIGSW